MSNFIPMYQYAQILDGVGQWRAISMRNLYEELGRKVSYSAFCRNIKKLEEHNYVKSIIGKKGEKFLVLTSLGSKFTSIHAFYDECHTGMNHDLIATNVVRSLSQIPAFSEGVCTAGNQTSQSLPDGEIIYLNPKGRSISLAIEIELTQKASKRIATKFESYCHPYSEYEHYIYVFSKPTAFKAYKRKLIELSERTDKAFERISLLLDSTISPTTFNPSESEYFYDGKNCNFFEIFSYDHKVESVTSHSQEVQTKFTDSSNVVLKGLDKISPKRFFAKI